MFFINLVCGLVLFCKIWLMFDFKERLGELERGFEFIDFGKEVDDFLLIDIQVFVLFFVDLFLMFIFWLFDFGVFLNVRGIVNILFELFLIIFFIFRFSLFILIMDVLYGVSFFGFERLELFVLIFLRCFI